jgi:CheY-like chemotaxis protein
MPTAAPSSPSILVAEDDAERRARYVAILTGAGYRVFEAADGARAVELARRERPGLVLMNVAVSVTSGWNAVRTLRDDPDTNPIPIILVADLTSVWDRDASFACGCDEYLATAVLRVRLLEEVRKYLPPVPQGSDS